MPTPSSFLKYQYKTTSVFFVKKRRPLLVGRNLRVIRAAQLQVPKWRSWTNRSEWPRAWAGDRWTGGDKICVFLNIVSMTVWLHMHVYIWHIQIYVYIYMYYMRHTRCTTVTFWENLATAIETHQLCRKSHENNTVLPLKQQLLISNSSWCETSESWIVDFVGSRRPRNSWEKSIAQCHNSHYFQFHCVFCFRFSRILVQEISKQPRILIGIGG